METHIFVFVILSMIFSFCNSCCFPKQMEAIEGVSIGKKLNGTNAAVQALYNISYDITGQKAFISGTTVVNGIKYTEQMLQDYQNGHQYVVVDGKCTVIPFNEMMMTCIPSGSELVMSTYYGFDNNKIDIEMYSFNYGGVQTTLSVTKQGCVPVAQHMLSDIGITDTSLVGITLGIKDMSVFDVPIACRNLSSHLKVKPEKDNSLATSLVVWKAI